MRMHWLRGLPLGVVLALLLFGGVALARGPVPGDLVGASIDAHSSNPGSGQGETCDPDEGYCMYETWVDNVGNGGTGPADDDMGWVGPNPYDYAHTCNGDDNYPIEFRIAVPSLDFSPSEAYLELVVPEDVEPSILGDVRLNGHLIKGATKWTGEPGWATLFATIDPSLVVVGDNLVEVELQPRFCLSVYDGFIFVTGYYDFVPEPGTFALLASGLAGLAGYASLRRRSRS